MLLGVMFLCIGVMGVIQNNAFVSLVAGVVAAGWFAASFVPMPCDCNKPCSNGRCDGE